MALPRPLLTSLSPPLAPPDVKFDAISGDYYPILYFNDYWNLQKDYFPINESLQRLPFRLSFCPLSLWRWQLYAAQSTKSPWNFLGEDLYEQSDEEQDSVKVRGAPPGALILGDFSQLSGFLIFFFFFDPPRWKLAALIAPGLGSGCPNWVGGPQICLDRDLGSLVWVLNASWGGGFEASF